MTSSTAAVRGGRAQPTRVRHRRRSLRTWLSTGALAVTALVFTFPFIWMFLTALKPRNEVFTQQPEIFGSEILWSNFATAWTVVPFGRFILNGFVVAVLGALLSVVVAVLSAYAFSRLEFPFRDRIFLVFVGTLVLPQEVLVVPLYIMMNGLGWVDTYVALIIPFAFTAFGTFLMRQFFLTIPVEYEEAARIDGASRLRTLVSVLLPQLRAPVSVLGVFSFIGYWNSYLWPLIAINSQDKATVPLGLTFFTGEHGTEWNYVMAASTIAVIPSIVIVALLQRQLVKGVSMGGFGGR